MFKGTKKGLLSAMVVTVVMALAAGCSGQMPTSAGDGDDEPGDNCYLIEGQWYCDSP